MINFSELGVSKNYIKALRELNIESPTIIQQKTLPILLDKKTDFIGLAQTGTGKTAAFGLPILQKINTNKNEVQSLIIAPTRELVQQIKKQLFKFTKYSENKIFVEGIYGGEKINKQIAALKRTTHVIVATPGRLLELIEKGNVDISHVSTLVLDEADEMLSMGFKEDLSKILKYNTSERNTWLFSATMPGEIKNIIKTYMSNDAVRVEINKGEQVNANINHEYVITSIKEKSNIIKRILAKRSKERGIIFCRTKAGTTKLAAELKEQGFSIDALQGDMQQKERDKVMRAFKNGSLKYLVSSDVSARGIDVNNLGFVIHHQLPETLGYYTHRSGRTARAGNKGTSLALIIHDELEKIKEFEKALEIQFVHSNLD